MNRRTMNAALQTVSLDPEARVFLSGSQAVVKPATPEPAETVLESPRVVPPPQEPRKVRRSIPSESEDSNLVSITVRVPHMVPHGLLLASVDRKLNRQRPWTQQEIVAEALMLWLKKHDYLE